MESTYTDFMNVNKYKNEILFSKRFWVSLSSLPSLVQIDAVFAQLPSGCQIYAPQFLLSLL